MSETSDPRSEAMRLVIVHRRMIETYAYALTRDFNLADDIYQDVALVVVADWEHVPVDDGVVPWLKEVTRRKTLEFLRKRARMPRMLSPEALQRVEAAFPDPAQHDLGLSAALAKCVEKLPADSRRAIQERYGENLPVPDIARRMGRTVQGAYAVLKRARLMLEDCVGRARSRLA